MRLRWDRLSQTFGREVMDAWMLGRLYLAIVKATLLVRAYTSVVTPYIGILLGSFYHRVVWQMWIRNDGTWY